MQKLKPAIGGFFVEVFRTQARQVLFELDFLVLDVLARYRVEFQHFQFFWSDAFILGSGIKMAGSCRRFELYFFPHDSVLSLDSEVQMWSRIFR